MCESTTVGIWWSEDNFAVTSVFTWVLGIELMLSGLYDQMPLAEPSC